MAASSSTLLLLIVVVVVSLSEVCQGRSFNYNQQRNHHNRHRQHHNNSPLNNQRNLRARRQHALREMRLNYRLEGDGSGASNAHFMGGEGDQNDLDRIVGAIHGPGGPPLSVPGFEAVSNEDLDKGRKTLQPVNINAGGLATQIQFGAPMRIPYFMTEQQKRDMYRKTIELCRQIKAQLAKTMNLEIECSYPGI